MHGTNGEIEETIIREGIVHREERCDKREKYQDCKTG
jgi:hypothetical protein